jgi:hypothetical protein
VNEQSTGNATDRRANDPQTVNEKQEYVVFQMPDFNNEHYNAVYSGV